MSLKYYTELTRDASESSGPLANAIRITLAIYWQLQRARVFPVGLNAEDTDEAISTIVGQLPKLLDKWEPSQAALSTYLFAVIPRRLKGIITKLHNQTARLVTNVFDQVPGIDGADEATPEPIAVGNEDITDLPLNDLVYSDEPIGMLKPEDEARLEEQIYLLDKLEKGMSKLEYARRAGCTERTAYRRHEKLIALRAAQNEV